MPTDPTDRLVSGVLGRFWFLDENLPEQHTLNEDDAVYGQVQLVDGEVRIRTQDPAEDPSLEALHESLGGFAEGAEKTPHWVFGITEIGPVVMPVVRWAGHHYTFGGAQVSVRTVRGPSLAVSVKSPFGPLVKALSVRLPHADWADLNPMTVQGHLENQRWQGVDYALRGTGPLTCGRVGRIALSLSGTWNQAEREIGHRTSIVTGLEIYTESKTPRQLREHTDLAKSVQDLVSLAYDNLEPAYNARIVLEGDTSGGLETWFYHGDIFMPRPESRRNAGRELAPYFTLADLGGLPSISRWVSLCHHFADAANAIRVRDRAATNPTRRTVELGAAIEQYVGICKKDGRGRNVTLKWTATKKTRQHPTALAEHAGQPFAEFVGDPTTWGQNYYDAYVNEKHLIGNRRDASDLVALNSSAQLLLVVTLLNRASGSRTAGKKLLAHFRVALLGDTIRAMLGTTANNS